MMNIVKFILTTIGVAIFVACITGEVDGVGRFAMILFGTIFTYSGLLIKGKK